MRFQTWSWCWKGSCCSVSLTKGPGCHALGREQEQLSELLGFEKIRFHNNGKNLGEKVASTVHFLDEDILESATLVVNCWWCCLADAEEARAWQNPRLRLRWSSSCNLTFVLKCELQSQLLLLGRTAVVTQQEVVSSSWRRDAIFLGSFVSSEGEG